MRKCCLASCKNVVTEFLRLCLSTLESYMNVISRRQRQLTDQKLFSKHFLLSWKFFQNPQRLEFEPSGWKNIPITCFSSCDSVSKPKQRWSGQETEVQHGKQIFFLKNVFIIHYFFIQMVRIQVFEDFWEKLQNSRKWFKTTFWVS